MRWLAAIKMSLYQYFRLLLDYRDIWIYHNEKTSREFGCDLIILSWFYYSVDKLRELPGWRLVKDERCVFGTLLSGGEIRLHRYKIITLDKLIKKEMLKRFNRFKEQNMR